AVRDEIIDSAALIRVIESNAGKSIAGISCIDSIGDNEPALSFTIALQPQTFQHVYGLFSKLILGLCEAQYTISVGFMMFRSPSASGDLPTLDEFKSGQPYFSDEVSVSARRAQK
ncbi:MAG: hypothetical protein CVU18_21650, partial [Betaproteobacteria bacterium HGW-Betaproteobacteria-12]